MNRYSYQFFLLKLLKKLFKQFENEYILLFLLTSFLNSSVLCNKFGLFIRLPNNLEKGHSFSKFLTLNKKLELTNYFKLFF